MNKRSINALALQLAKLSVQDDAMQERRYIWRESDFTPADWDKIKATQQVISAVFTTASGTSWVDNIYPQIKAACPNLRIGFGAQDQCIARLCRAGIEVTA